MIVTTQSPFRSLGNTTKDAFVAALSRSIGGPSPMAAEAEEIYAVLGVPGLTRLGAAMCWIERRNETDPGGLRYYPREYHNAWAVKNPDGSWARYDSYAEAASAWASRILSPTYGDLVTLAQFIARYAPAFDGNDPTAYARLAAEEINAMPLLGTGDPAAPLDPWRPLAYPRMRMAIVRKPGENAGFTRVASRRSRIVGVCDHITDGDPGGDEIEWYRAFFATGGERQWDALVDTVIARDGEIGVLNDWRDDNNGGTRSPWANGWGSEGPGLEGPGVRFYAQYPAINDVLVSKEHVARSGQSLTDAQIASSIALTAAVAQEVKCPYDTFPIHPGKRNVDISEYHTAFAKKACPTPYFINDVRPVILREVVAILTKHQTGSTNPPAPPPDPPPPAEPVYPFGFTREAMEFFWGTLRRHDGQSFRFDPKGPLSLLWLDRCRQEGKFPEAESWSLFGGRDVVQWEGGWTAIREPGANAAWYWLDKGAPAPTIVRG